MTISLDQDTIPAGLQVKTFGHAVDGNVVHIGNYEVSLDDFLVTAMYVLTNTDLVAGDPRLPFVASMASLREVPGWQQGRTRLGLP